MKALYTIAVLLAFLVLTNGCGVNHSVIGGVAGDATPVTLAANERFAQLLTHEDVQDSEEAQRGFIARPTGKITNARGEVLIDFDAFAFVTGAPPRTVNPSLWRHAILNNRIGLFRVTDGIYQLRGFDIANMTLIEGKTGWIVVDPLTCRETAQAALSLARKHLGERPISAVIFTHSHLDHFGGVLGVLSSQEAAARKIPVIAPEGFMAEAVSENILVGTAMGRRANYQFGITLERSARGTIDAGLGKAIASGTSGILPPTIIIRQAEETMTVDGVRFIFYNVPGAEAPAELTFLLPEKKTYCGAELLNRTMHNLLPVRGAKVRSALRWANYLQQALEQAADADVCFNTHNHPVWGRARIAEYIAKQRDVYKYTHDQTVRLINAGHTPREIADRIHLPASLSSYLAGRGYYGDLRHNVKAVYQFYMGFYDGNPANLNPLPPEESASRYVKLAGGADKAVAEAQDAFDRGDYRWSAELLNHVVFAEPDHKTAVELLARTYEQMGYMAEAATWRNSYLTAAHELRNGPPTTGYNRRSVSDMLLQTPTKDFLDAMAAALDGPAAEGKNLKINLIISDTGESHVLWIENAVLHHRKAPPSPDAGATLTLSKKLFVRMLTGGAGAKDALASGELKVAGSRIELVRFFTLLGKAPGTFPIVKP